MDTVPKLLSGIKLSNELPQQGSSYDYYSSFPSFRTLIAAQSNNILLLIQRLIDFENGRGSVLSTTRNKDIQLQFESLSCVNDDLLERVAGCMDEQDKLEKEESMQRHHPSVVVVKDNTISSAKSALSAAALKFLAARNVPRPQSSFKVPPDNSRNPFVHKLQLKHNAIFDSSDGADYDGPSHPYTMELLHFSPASHFIQPPSNTNMPSSLDDTEFCFVKTLDALLDLIKKLSKANELAVDLEAHTYRSFLGITCLMQLSTRKADYIIDVLQLWDEMWRMNEVFSNPNIVKVFHGSSSDLFWLQRDFNIYVVNLFDTFFASHSLALARHSLSHLLQSYCNYSAKKEFQMADWRMRPLPDELIRYARSDSHYLLYLFDRMKQDLFAKSNNTALILDVFDKSKQLCLRPYEKPMFHSSHFQNLADKAKKSFNVRQLYAMEALYSWRDSIARLEDESWSFVLPDHMLITMCEVLPREYTGIFACCNPIPPLIRKYVHDIHKLIQEAREKSLEGDSSSSLHFGTLDSSATNCDILQRSISSIQNNLVHFCPHDKSDLDVSCDIHDLNNLDDSPVVNGCSDVTQLLPPQCVSRRQRLQSKLSRSSLNEMFVSPFTDVLRLPTRNVDVTCDVSATVDDKPTSNNTENGVEPHHCLEQSPMLPSDSGVKKRSATADEVPVMIPIPKKHKKNKSAKKGNQFNANSKQLGVSNDICPVTSVDYNVASVALLAKAGSSASSSQMIDPYKTSGSSTKVKLKLAYNSGASAVRRKHQRKK